MEKVLEVEGLTKLYSNGRGVQDISFVVKQGDIFGFLGPNGAGKTTVMKAIVGLNSLQRGQIHILGHDLQTDLEAALQKTGTIIETADLYEYLTAYHNLKFVARYHPQLQESALDDALALVQLTPYKHEKVAKFSLGMKQRLALAMALLAGPELVILDEPTNGLDIEGTVQMRNLILELARSKQTTFFISSHLVHEVELMCNKVAIIHQGKMINQGADIQDIKRQYSSLEEFYLQQIQGGAVS